MSRSPLEATAVDGARDYRESFLALRHMMRQGNGWSGHETHCAFLNTGGGEHPAAPARFAEISAVSGFDFADDGRGIALSDWDQDGDVDFWASNRTGPRLRLMLNQEHSGHHFVAFRLEGTRSNRDAVGARLEVQLPGARGTRVRSVRAGEGFLSQSSRWLHVGLGDATQVASLQVRWPSGATERFDVPAVDTFYTVREGDGALQPWEPPRRDPGLTAQPLPQPARTRGARVFLAERVPAPPLRYQDFEGRTRTLAADGASPVLVNLWASWCTPCVQELTEFTRRADRLRALGVQVVALALDGVGERAVGKPEEALHFLQRLSFPFPSGRGTPELLDRIELVHGALMHPLRPFPIPTSMLIDRRGWIAAFYQGPVDLETLAADVAHLDDPPETWRDRAVPFPGTWAAPRAEYDYLTAMGLDFLDAGQVETAENHYRRLLERGPARADWLHHLARALLERGAPAAAESVLRRALALDPQHPEVNGRLGVALAAQQRWAEAVGFLERGAAAGDGLRDVQERLAWYLATHPDPARADPQRAVRLAQDACRQSGFADPQALMTLAAALARQSRYDEALRTAEQARTLAQRHGDGALAQRLTEHVHAYRNHTPVLDPATQTVRP